MRPVQDIRVLNAFIAVAREGNVTRAAEKLHLTQPAVSLQLKRLAQDTGLILFTRTAKGLELTRDGTALIAKAEKVRTALTEFGQQPAGLVEMCAAPCELALLLILTSFAWAGSCHCWWRGFPT